MKQLSKWAYIDDDHNLRIDVPVLLEEMNVEDTPANREVAMAGASEALKDLCSTIEAERLQAHEQDRNREAL